MNLPKECLNRACYTCPLHKKCLFEKQMENDLNSDTVKYFIAAVKQQYKHKK